MMARWLLAGVMVMAGLGLAQPVLAQQRWTLEVSGVEPGVDFMGQPAVTLSLTKEGQAVFTRLTERYVGQVLDLLVDGEVITSPMVQTVVNTPSVVLTGDLTMQEAIALAASIKDAGALVEVRAPGKTKAK